MVGDIGEFQLAKKVEQGRLVSSHRVVSVVSSFDRSSPTIPRWLLTSPKQRSRTPKSHQSRGRHHLSKQFDGARMPNG